MLASSSTWGQTTQLVSDGTKIVDETFTRVTFLHEDTLAISDLVDDKRVDVTYDTLKVNEESTGVVHAAILIEDSIKVTEAHTGVKRNREELSDSIVVGDEIVDTTSGIVIEAIKATDDDISTHRAFSMVSDAVIATDTVIAAGSVVELIEDNITVSTLLQGKLAGLTVDLFAIQDEVQAVVHTQSLVDEFFTIAASVFGKTTDNVEEHALLADDSFGKLTAKAPIDDVVQVVDEFVQSVKFSQLATDEIIISEEWGNKLKATNTVDELIFIDDETNKSRAGAAWTSDLRAWAMSKYIGYDYDELTVIDGRLHGVNDSGVYDLGSGGNEIIEGYIATGKLDLSGESLVHPLAAYVEYQLDNGDMSIDVTSTQSGSEQTYKYLLPTENANRLTNGRMVFGRGLRGRHFSFKLNLRGSKCHVNTLNIDMSDTKRRI